MPTIVDEDVIRQKAVSDAYRDGWERCFGDAPHAEPADKCTDAIECTIKSWANVQVPVAIATFPAVEPVEASKGDPDAFKVPVEPWPDSEAPRYNGSGEPCDVWNGPCCCGAWHHDGK